MQAKVLLKFDTGVLANVFLTTKIGLDKVMTIQGTKGKLVIPEFWRAKKATLYDLSGHVLRELHAAFDSDFVAEVRHVNQMILSGALESPIMTEEMTVSGVQVLDDLYQSWQ